MQLFFGGMMLSAGDYVPFFEITDINGQRVRYRNLWQRKNLLLVTVPERVPGSQPSVAPLKARMDELIINDTEVVITSDPVEGMPVPGVLVGDQWGEIYHVSPFEAGDRDGLNPDALIEWLRYVQHQCPECQGEAR